MQQPYKFFLTYLELIPKEIRLNTKKVLVKQNGSFLIFIMVWELDTFLGYSFC